MKEEDALYALGAMLAPALQRVGERCERGRTLEKWGLKPHRPDPRTSMALDDGDGYDRKIPEGLSGTVMFPIMNATDALASADILITAAAKKRPFNHHTASFLALCRTAVECSAQAIWVMSPVERDVRRARAAGLAKVGTEHARDYHDNAIQAHDQKLRVLPDVNYKQSQHRLKFHKEEIATLDALDQENGRKYTDLVRKAANWIEENPPAHATETQNVHIPTLSKQQYRLCSSFIHGHSWPTDLIGGGPSGMFSMMADAINTALIYTESAVCLYEAQSTDPDSTRTNYYPEELQPTIDTWRALYAAEV
ncbi:hypothetical protein [Williamsia soli]|uniref:hypothetical protein n=1 Tax=Williamsia soli TaxID=364929 RepID=UPI001A9E4E87|nr:hypothetical protein [Williamsia soli]